MDAKKELTMRLWKIVPEQADRIVTILEEYEITRTSERGELDRCVSSHLLPSANSRSLPARGAWIEIPSSIARRMLRPGRSPQGERGLKSDVSMPYITEAESLPARGAWIEIRPDRDAKTRKIVAPRKGSVD